MSLRIRVMYQPLSVSSTLQRPAGQRQAMLNHKQQREAQRGLVHVPSLPRYLTKSVSVSHLVEFMWVWCLSLMYSW